MLRSPNGCNSVTFLHELNAKRYQSIRQSGKQSQIEKTFLRLDGSIQETSHVTRAKVESFDSFQTYLQNLHENVEQNREYTADEEIDRELNISTSRRTILFSQHLECPICFSSIRKEHFEDHRQLCKYHSTTDQLHATDEEESISVRPHPLRNLKVVAISFDAIQIDWDLPIFQGGEPIVDYEVSYSYTSLKKYSSKKSNSKYKMVHRRVFCLKFCNKSPMNKPFVIDGLSASAQYIDVKVRCKSSVGWSDFSEPIKSVTTKGKLLGTHSFKR